LDLRTVKSKLSEDEERKLATDMREIYDRLLPTEKVEEKRKKLVQKLEKIFNDEWPGHDIKVHLFGSSGNLLCSDDSDGECAACCLCSPPRHLRTDTWQWTFA
jgi:DNA polymerase sigma